MYRTGFLILITAALLLVQGTQEDRLIRKTG